MQLINRYDAQSSKFPSVPFATLAEVGVEKVFMEIDFVGRLSVRAFVESYTERTRMKVIRM